MTIEFLIYLLGIPAWWAAAIVGARLGKLGPDDAGTWLFLGFFWPWCLIVLASVGAVAMFQRIMKEVSPEEEE